MGKKKNKKDFTDEELMYAIPFMPESFFDDSEQMTSEDGELIISSLIRIVAAKSQLYSQLGQNFRASPQATLDLLTSRIKRLIDQGIISEEEGVERIAFFQEFKNSVIAREGGLSKPE